MMLPAEVTSLWIKRLLHAGFLTLPYDPPPGLADAQFYELELFSMRRSNTIKLLSSTFLFQLRSKT